MWTREKGQLHISDRRVSIAVINVCVFFRERATVGGGCFWGLELAFQRVPGVVSTSVGYINGHQKSPSYEDVCSGNSGGRLCPAAGELIK